MLDMFNQWATSNPDTAYLLGFSVIVAIFFGLSPYQSALNVAVSKGVPFRSINVWSQIKRPNRIALCMGAVIIFAFFHFGLGAPLFALVFGAAPVALLAITDYRQIEREYDAVI